jgi:ubiquinone/menaquinone biosynthesis C-methylase UbiE
MSEDDDSMWNRLADRYHATVGSGHPMYARYDEVLRGVAETANVVAGMEVLDIGTGTGNLAEKCLSRGAIVTAVDPSEGMLSVADSKLKPRFGDRLRLLHMHKPFLCSGFSDKTFDAIVSSYAFHHVPRCMHRAALQEMFRVLRPAGIWVIADLAFEDEKAEVQALQEHRWLEAEEFAILKVLRDDLSDCGYRLRCTQFTPVTWVFWPEKHV